MPFNPSRDRIRNLNQKFQYSLFPTHVLTTMRDNNCLTQNRIVWLEPERNQKIPKACLKGWRVPSVGVYEAERNSLKHYGSAQ